MKASLRLILLLVGISLPGAAATFGESAPPPPPPPLPTTGGHIEAVAVAEQIGAAQAPAGQTGNYYACDGGFIEGGDAIAGERPPTPAAVADALRSSLGAAGFQPASAAAAPSLVIVYHWGVIHPRRGARSTLNRLDPNLHARLSLVTTASVLANLEPRLILRKQHMGTINDLVERPSERDALDLAHGSRYFIIVSAYDYAAMTRRQATTMWRTKLSTQDTSGAMDQCIISLAASGRNYFGRGLTDAQFFNAPVVALASPEDNASVAEIPAALAANVDATWLRQLIHRQHVVFSGEYGPSDNGEFSEYRPAPAPGSASAPPAPAWRIEG